MKPQLTRRNFFGMAATAAIAGSTTSAASAATAPAAASLKILGVSCSPRRGMSTAKAVQAALDAAKNLDARIEVELIDLGGLRVGGWSPEPITDDFNPLLPKLRDPAVAGLIIGSPCYYRSLSSLCKSFIERCGPLREPTMLLDGKPLGVVATGGSRNGGQELVVTQIQSAMLSFGMIPVGARPPAFLGGMLQSAKDDISADETGLASARHTGLRVADMALRFAGVTANGPAKP